MNRLLEENQHMINRRPEKDFDGISREQMYFLLNDPMGEKSLIQFHAMTEISLAQIPLLALSDLLITKIKQTGKLKLTVGGNLPVSICEYLLAQNLIDWKYRSSLTRVQEENIPYLTPLKHYLIHSKLVEKHKNALVLTCEGERIARANLPDRFIHLFMFIAGRYNWENFNRLKDNGIYGQLGWAFSLCLLARYGNEPQDARFYSDKVMRAYFPELYDHRDDEDCKDQASWFGYSYDYRFFEVFSNWFGLVDISYQDDPGTLIEKLTIRKTALFDQLFTVCL